jgi:hypothetical protein
LSLRFIFAPGLVILTLPVPVLDPSSGDKSIKKSPIVKNGIYGPAAIAADFSTAL